MQKRAILIANSASMIDHFNRDNIAILKELGYEVTVAANFKEGNSSTNERVNTFAKELDQQGIEIIDLPIPRKLSQIKSALKSIRILKKYFQKNPCQLVHSQTPFGGVVGRIAAKESRREGTAKVIYFVHGFHFFKGAPLKNYLVYYNIEKYLTKFTDCLITLNQEDYSTALRKFKNTNVKYVPGVGIDTINLFEKDVDINRKRKQIGIPENHTVVLNVAELIPRKNIETTIRAFAKACGDDTSLVICGKGALEQQLKELAANLGIEDKVHFLGYRTDIIDIYKCSDIFLFTSYQEGLSVALMQAMATGLPIVASDIRGNRDLLEPYEDSKSSEYLVKPDDVDTFAEKLKYMIDNADERRTIGKENMENCHKYFDIKIVHEKMSEIYKELE